MSRFVPTMSSPVLPGAVLLVAGALAACGSPADSPEEVELVTTAAVLESDDHGPQLCWAMAESMPPQCSGPDVADWDWDEVEGEQSEAGTRWIDVVRLHGTFDGQTFTPTREPETDVPPDEAGETDLDSPCPEPEDGWFADTDGTGADDLQAAVERADRLDDVAEVWIDDRGDERQRPTHVVLNVAVTGDRDEAEASLRQVWPGALCVSGAERSTEDLQQIADSLEGVDGFVGSSIGRGVVDLQVAADVDGALQRELDEQHGEGVVRVEPMMRPVNDE